MMEIVWLLLGFLKIGATAFGGGYGMMSLIIAEARDFSITLEQIADLNALDMVVPGPIAINAATYVGYLGAGFWGSLAATLGVMIPSFVFVALIMRFIDRYRKNHIMLGVLSGVKPAAVGLIVAAALTLAIGVIAPGHGVASILADPMRSVNFRALAVFAAVALLNIRFSVNPILLTVLAGVVGALFFR
jgi:chromate transporter